MRNRAILLLAFLAITAGASAQQPPKRNQDPDAARLVTSDIPNFWRVFDKVSLKDAAELFQREYFDTGSAGLHDLVESRIASGRNLAGTIAARPRYYAAIRANTLAVDQTPAIKEPIRASFHRLKDIYPDAVFPDVYFVIGRMNSAGTVSSNGLLIGVEMNARNESTPMDELTWERAVIGQIANLPHIVAHELIHIQLGSSTGSSAVTETPTNKPSGRSFRKKCGARTSATGCFKETAPPTSARQCAAS